MFKLELKFDSENLPLDSRLKCLVNIFNCEAILLYLKLHILTKNFKFISRGVGINKIPCFRWFLSVLKSIFLRTPCSVLAVPYFRRSHRKRIFCLYSKWVTFELYKFEKIILGKGKICFTKIRINEDNPKTHKTLISLPDFKLKSFSFLFT